MMKSDPCMIRSQSTPTIIWDFVVGFALGGNCGIRFLSIIILYCSLFNFKVSLYFLKLMSCFSFQMGHEAFEHASAGGAPPGGPGFEGFGETIFGDAFNGGVDEVIFLAISCAMHHSCLVVHHHMCRMLYLQGISNYSIYMHW